MRHHRKDLLLSMLLDIWQAISPFIIPIYYGFVLLVVINMLLENKNPLKTQSYLLLLLLLPIIGVFIYLIFGQNARKRKIFSKRKLINAAFGKKYIDEHLDNIHKTDASHASLDNPYFRLIHFLNKDLSPVTATSEVSILKNGEEKFPQLFEELKKAKSHIHIEYYIFSDDDIGKQVTDILIEKVKEGVEVRLFVDSVGSFALKKKFFKKLRSTGIEVFEFMPVIFPLFTSKINYRDHRKIVVIDGKTGFTGGINLDDRYLNNGKHQLYWRDTHLMIKGEAVKTLQLLFFLNWQFVSKQSIEPSRKYFPVVKNMNGPMVQINGSGPDWDLASIMDSFFIAINSAQKEIRITTPYFIPNESILDAIITSSKSGIRIELMLPFESDSWIVKAASMSFVKELLEADVRIFLYQKGFMHAKTITVDGAFASVGTANMDYRSFDLNYEVNTFIYDRQLTATLNKHFEEDKKDCIELGLETWNKRKLREKLLESVCRLLAPML